MRTLLHGERMQDYPGPFRGIIATAGARESLKTTARVWPVKVNAKSGRPVYCLSFDHNFRSGRLYRETIQHF